ncbi:MAG: hypothetical protein JWN78_1497 [Bacteroidota bacterium]|nr:hypothetical protein [Bacteroidota bacterium]
MSKKSAFLILLFACFYKMLDAKTTTVADKLMEQNKLYAVIAVLAVIMLGIFIFLFYLERKIKKLEEEVKN